MKTVWKYVFVFLLAVGGIFSASLNTLAAGKPYEYTFEKVTDADVNNPRIDIETNLFNGIKAINKLKITFDKEISPTEEILFDVNRSNNPVKLVERGKEDPVKIISDVKVDADNAGRMKILTVYFKNLDFIDYTNPNLFEYELVINKNTLQFDQLEEYRIPITIFDLLPGFKSTFIDTNSTILNNNIFKTNAPRDISVHVPKIYIRGIETIHHYDGILPNPIPKEDGDIIQDPVNENTRRNPALTNIDVIADEDADRLKVTFKNNEEYSRDLNRRREDVDGFTMGHAGIRDITKYKNESLQEFQLRAFDENGRFLEQRDFKLRVTDPLNDYIVTDYLPEPTDEFGETYSLYDLMADRTMLENIITRIPVSQLDSLRLTYAVGKQVVKVDTEEQLLEALRNHTITNIILNDIINLDTTLIIDRSISIEGKQLNGAVKLGTGDDINIKLSNLQIASNFTIDIGANGTLILENVTVDDDPSENAPNPITKIISSGSNSIHAKGFKSAGGIYITNETPIRFVNEGVRNVININGNAPVTLEGEYDKVTVVNTHTLNLINFVSPYSIDLVNTDSVELIASPKINSVIEFLGTGPVTLIGNYGSVNVKSADSRLMTTRNTAIDSITVQDGKRLDITGEGTINAVHGNVTLPSALFIDVSAEAVAAADSDKVLIKFNKKVFKDAIGNPLIPGYNSTNGDFDDYFYVMKGDRVLNPIFSNPYKIVDDNQNNIADDNQTFSILLRDNIKKGEQLKIGLKPGMTLYDENGKPITGATKTVTVTSLDNTFAIPTAIVANNSNKITLDFAEDVDTATVGSGDFSVIVNGTSRSVNNVNAYGDKIDIYLYNTTLSTDNSVTIYLNTHAQGKITDKVGNKLNSYNETVIVPQ